MPVGGPQIPEKNTLRPSHAAIVSIGAFGLGLCEQSKIRIADDRSWDRLYSLQQNASIQL
jgi:hypothetical protein